MKTKHYKQKISINSLAVMSCLLVMLGLSGCEDKKSAEKAGQKIDHAAENAHEKIEDAQQSLDQQAHEAGEYIAKSAEASKNALENANTRMNQTTEQVKNSVMDNAATAEKYMNDAVISSAVKSALLNDGLVKAAKINISTVNGVVTLSGGVESKQSINRAIEVVESQPNVKSVKSEMIVNSPEQQ